jgi:hypothetical protein
VTVVASGTVGSSTTSSCTATHGRADHLAKLVMYGVLRPPSGRDERHSPNVVAGEYERRSGCYIWGGEKASPLSEGSIMSHVSAASSPRRTVTVARLTAALRRNWSEARIADRRLMEMRTNLSRHVG